MALPSKVTRLTHLTHRALTVQLQRKSAARTVLRMIPAAGVREFVSIIVTAAAQGSSSTGVNVANILILAAGETVIRMVVYFIQITSVNNP